MQFADRIERQLAAVTDRLFAAADLQPGERVLDVGCGTGPTTRRAAELVGEGGSVTAVDVSPEMIEAAKDRGGRAGTSVRWVVADAATWDGESAQFDAVISQFGVMFFADPPAAFANLARMTRPGGRLVAMAWADRTRSPLFELPLSIALTELARAGVTQEVPAPDAGPFSLSDPGRVEHVLDGAGWTAVSWEPHELSLTVGGGQGPAEAAESSLDFGPTRIVMEGVEGDVRAAVCAAIVRACDDHVDDSGRVVLRATPVLIRARRPGVT